MSKRASGYSTRVHQTYLDVAQDISIKYLRANLPNSDKLQQLCPLSRFSCVSDPEEDLGDLQALPLEIQHLVLEKMDTKSLLAFSLLAFSRLNKRAVQVVCSMADWSKVTACTLDTVRLAICIGTGHLFTLKQLATVLYSRQCVQCSRPAPYVDAFSLERRCLYTGDRDPWYRNCLPQRVPLSNDDWEHYGISKDDPRFLHLQSFRPLPGVYWTDDDHTLEIQEQDQVRYYEESAIISFNKINSDSLDKRYEEYNDQKEGSHVPQEETRYGYYHLSSVYAPWMSCIKVEYRPSMGVFCALCCPTTFDKDKDPEHPDLEQAQSAMSYPFFIDCDMLRKHVEGEHGFVQYERF